MNKFTMYFIITIISLAIIFTPILIVYFKQKCNNKYNKDCLTCIDKNYDPTKNCSVCKDNYDYNYQCKRCVLQNYDFNKDCKVCKDGYDPNQNCDECLNNAYNKNDDCKSCSSNYLDPDTNCTSCTKSKLLDPDKNCTSCTKSKLLDPDTKCTSCIDPVLNPDTKCTSCIDPVLNPDTKCTSCIDPVLNPDTKCTSCIDPVLNPDTKCTSCINKLCYGDRCTQCIKNILNTVNWEVTINDGTDKITVANISSTTIYILFKDDANNSFNLYFDNSVPIVVSGFLGSFFSTLKDPSLKYCNPTSSCPDKDADCNLLFSNDDGTLTLKMYPLY